MPTYEYECESCGHGFEQFQSMSDKPLKACPKCGRNMRRLIGAGSAPIVKGGGFHATDYGRSSGSSCSLDRTGVTCCGRNARCDSPACGG
jgi:putative FmdB family regulatory protein